MQESHKDRRRPAGRMHCRPGSLACEAVACLGEQADHHAVVPCAREGSRPREPSVHSPRTVVRGYSSTQARRARAELTPSAH